jgi:hypothetical protein
MRRLPQKGRRDTETGSQHAEGEPFFIRARARFIPIRPALWAMWRGSAAWALPLNASQGGNRSNEELVPTRGGKTRSPTF